MRHINLAEINFYLKQLCNKTITGTIDNDILYNSFKPFRKKPIQQNYNMPII